MSCVNKFLKIQNIKDKIQILKFILIIIFKLILYYEYFQNRVFLLSSSTVYENHTHIYKKILKIRKILLLLQ